MLAALAFSPVASASHGGPGHLHCGDVITADTTLQADVGPCATSASENGALTFRGTSGISSDRITLDLNGHHVYGCDAASLTGLCNQAGVVSPDPTLAGSFVTGEGVGIVIDEVDWVQITDGAGGGTVRDFDSGIVVRGGSHNLIDNVDVKNNVGTAASSSDYGEGIGLYTKGATGSTNNEIKANVVQGNGPFGGIALYNFDDLTGVDAVAGTTTANTVGGPGAGDRNLVLDNFVVPNGTTFQDDGIRIEPKVTHTTVQNNEVSGSSLEGIAVFATAHDTNVLDNYVHDNGFQPLLTQRKGDGIRVFLRAERATVTGNRVCGNAGSGISVDSAANPLYPTSTQRSTIQNNVSGNDGTNVPACPANAVGPDLPTRPAYDFLEGGHAAASESCRHIWSGNLGGTAFPTCTK